MRNFLLRLLDNRSQLILWTLVLSSLPLLRWFAAMLLVLATLRLGAKIGSQLVLAILVPTILLVVLHRVEALPAIAQAVRILLLFGLSVLLRATGSWMLLLQLLTVVGLAVVVVAHWQYPDIGTVWAAFVKPQVEAMKSLPAAFSGGISEEDLSTMIDRLAKVATGLQVMASSAVVLITLAFGRYCQAALFNPGGLRQELYRLHLSPGYASLLVALLLAMLWTDQAVLLDCLGVVLLPLIVAGLSLLHYVTARSNHQNLWLVFCYIALFLFPPQVLVLLIGASFIDAWWNVRQRYAFKR